MKTAANCRLNPISATCFCIDRIAGTARIPNIIGRFRSSKQNAVAWTDRFVLSCGMNVIDNDNLFAISGLCGQAVVNRQINGVGPWRVIDDW